MMKKSNVIKIFILIIFISLSIYSLYKMHPILENITTIEGKLKFREYIQENYFNGILTLSAFQFIQIFLIIVPGEPIEVISGACFGIIGGTLFIVISNIIISYIIISLTRYLGEKFTKNFSDEKKLLNLKRHKIFNDKKNIEYILFILFFIPGTPKDLLTYLGALTNVNIHRLVLIITISRITSIIPSVIIGANLIEGSLKVSIIIYATVFMLTLLIIIIINIFDKNKNAIKLLKLLKDKKGK